MAALAAGLVVIAAALAPWVEAWMQINSEVEEYLETPGRFEPWNSERRNREALTAEQPVHRLHHGLAVSAQGGMVALSTPAHPVNELLLLDLKARRSWRLKHPIGRVGLLQPTFSPRGDKLAFVVGVPSFTGEFDGVSEIWITDLRGEVERVISSPGRMHKYPTFSPDGERLAFFGDVHPQRPLRNTRWVPHENRHLKPAAIYELDLRSGKETRLTQAAVGGTFGLSYAPDGQDLTFVSVSPLRPVKVEGETAWISDDKAAEETHLFTLVRARPEGVVAVPHSEVTVRGGTLAGYFDRDIILLHSIVDPAAEGIEHRLLAVDASGARTWFTLRGLHDRYLNQPAVSAQGRVVALENGVLGQRARFPEPSELTLVIVDPPGRTTTIPIDAFAPEPTAIRLKPENSEIRETA